MFPGPPCALAMPNPPVPPMAWFAEIVVFVMVVAYDVEWAMMLIAPTA